MILLKMLPDIIKELVKQVPTLLFEAIDWTEFGQELPRLSKRILKKEGYQALLKQQKEFLEKINLPFLDNLPQQESKALPLTQDTGYSLLSLYFAQLYSPHGVFLDLRLQHFSTVYEKTFWIPSSLFTQFSDRFRTGLLEIYRGFYLEDDSQFEQGLIQTGLLKPDWPNEKKTELITLFKSHFGESLHGEMQFDLEKFKSSFFKIGEFLLKNKMKISIDFLYLGIYLISLHLSLNEIKFSLPVQKIFKETDNHFKA